MALDPDRRQELRGRAQELPVHLRMGKAGLSDAFLDELRDALDRERLVKIRLLRSATAGEDVDDVAEQAAQQAGAHLVETRGSTAVLYRPRGGI